MDIAKKSNYIGSRGLDNKDRMNEYISNVDGDLKTLFQFAQGRVRFGGGADGEQGENIHGEFQVVSDTGSANTEFSITHTLGATPIGFLVTNIDKGGVIYDSGTSWTSTTIYLKCSVANANVTLFLLK